MRKMWLVLLYQGGGRRCPFCHLNFRRFIAYRGEPSPLYTQEHVIGSGPFADSICPACSSVERERHVYLFLKTCTSVFNKPIRMLHLAPELNLQRALKRCKNVKHVSADLVSSLASINTDVTALCFRDKMFDVVICNHVLEHISDDYLAMKEIFRVLKPGGMAILQVPIAVSRLTTTEDPTVCDPAARRRLFGQDDHVRLYGQDYSSRLESTGFTVERRSLSKEKDKSYSRRFGLLPDEDIYVATRPTLSLEPSYPTQISSRTSETNHIRAF
jgi:SAM-dependent methyltransferase